MKWFVTGKAQRQILRTMDRMLKIAKINLDSVTGHKAELDELRAFRLASIEAERELRARLNALSQEAGSMAEAYVRLVGTVVNLSDKLHREDGAMRVRLDALEATEASGRNERPKGRC